MKMSYAKKLVFTAVCAALCVVLPMAFHAVQNAGQIFLPMHIPVLLCGLMCGWPYGFVCGLLGPALSSLLTGMPPAAMLPSMMIECAAYGCFTGLSMKIIRTKRATLDLYISMVIAMLLGRVLAGLAKAWILSPGTAPFAWVTTSLVAGIPGIVIQLILIPLVVFALTKAKLLPARYPKLSQSISKQDVTEFFDRHADSWDADMIRNDAVIATILDNAGVAEGKTVLDVACGTGVLFGDYLDRKVAHVTAVDISPKMVEIARGKYPDAPIEVLCADAETADFGKKFDCIVIYNAFPHFSDPEKVIAALAGHLVPGGKLTVAHGMSRACIDSRHTEAASTVSLGLMHEDQLAAIFEKHLTVTAKISDDTMYQVCGRKEA